MLRGTREVERALKTHHSFAVLFEVWRGGKRLDMNLKVTGGGVSKTLEPGVRSSLTLNLLGDKEQHAALAPDGVEIRVTWRTYLIDTTYFDFPLGRFDIKSRSVTYNEQTGQISMSGKDYYSRLIRSRFEKPRTPKGPLLEVVEGFVREVIPDVVFEHRSSTTTTVRRRVFKRDRGDDIANLLASVGMHGYFDGYGRFVTEDVPSLTGPSDLFVREGRTLVSASTEETQEGVYNVVVVNPTADWSWRPQTLEDTSPLSPTRVGGDFGRVPRFYASSFIRNEAQARRAGAALLKRTTGMHTTVSASILLHPGLEPGDVLTIALPEQSGVKRLVQRHIVDTVDFPFAGGAQSITTRSSRPTESGDEEQ